MTLKELLEAQQQRSLELQAIAEAVKKEKREFTKEELAKISELKQTMRENEIAILRERNKSLTIEPEVGVKREVAFANWFKERAKDREQVTLQREAMVTTSATPMIPLTINDIIQPLENGLILGKVGLKLQMGLAGNYVWPTIAAIEAEIAGENVALSDTTIDIGKVTPTQQRVGVSISLSNQLINDTMQLAYQAVTQQLPMAVTRAINKAMFSPVTMTANKMDGPFVACKTAAAAAISTLNTKAKRKAATHITFVGELPTYKELLAMRGVIMSKGVINDGTMCYVMDEYTKSLLASTPRDTGSGLMIVENDMIAGVPVFCTNYINEDEAIHVGLGVWSYEALGQFGEQRFSVDATSKEVASKDSVSLTLNGNWSMTTLRPEAFLLGDCTIA